MEHEYYEKRRIDPMKGHLSISDITREILDRDKDSDIIYKIVETMKKMYGDRVVKVILFGSHRDDKEELWTGIDIMVFIERMKDRWTKLEKITSKVVDISLEFGINVSIVPFDSSVLNVKLMPILLEAVLEKGVEL